MVRTILIVSMCLLACENRTYASQAWGVTVGNNAVGSTAFIRLHEIDTSTGEVGDLSSSTGSIQGASVSDLASDPLRHPTFVWAVRDSSVGNELIAVDPFREEIVSNALIDAPQSILSIAIDPLTGVMFGASSAAIYSIDPFDGSSNLVGNTSAPVTKGLGFDSTGRLFGIEGNNRLVEVDTLTAATSLVAELDVIRMEDIAVRPEDGVMYGLGYADYQLFTINLDDGAVSSVGNSLGRPGGLAFTAVPEPSTGLIAMTASCAVFLQRKRFRFGYLIQ